MGGEEYVCYISIGREGRGGRRRREGRGYASGHYNMLQGSAETLHEACSLKESTKSQPTF